MEIILTVLIGYLIGTANPSYLFGKLKGCDVKENGSRNAGASNALILFGNAIGFTCALLDIAKPCLAIWLSGKIFPDFQYAYALTGAGCILGHMYPFYMNFRGGKGLACLGGVILAYDARVFAVLLLTELVIALLTNYLCFVPITASLLFPAVYGVLTGDVISALILLIPAVFIIPKHFENLRRIKKGTELHFSYLWKKNSEIERITSNLENEEKA